jgi:hypothetical protein
MAKKAPPAPAGASVQSFRVADDLYLVRNIICSGATAAPAKPARKHHIWVMDVSGSMSGTLSQMARHLSDRVRDAVNIGDTVTAIYFSGRSQCDVFIDAVEVRDLTTFSTLGAAFQKWLRAIGLTGFKRPLDLVATKAAEIQKRDPDGLIEVVFLSDGQETEGDRMTDILAAAKRAGATISSALVVRYGWWADEIALGQIATALGGSMQTAADFAKYTSIFEETVKRRGGAAGGKKVAVNCGVVPVDGFVFAIEGGALVTYAADGTTASVPDGTSEVFYLTTTAPSGSNPVVPGGLQSVAASAAANNPSDSRTYPHPSVVAAAYGAVALYAQRLRTDTVLRVLSSLGDVALIDAYAKTFGKQATARYFDAAQLAALNPTSRFASGYDPKRVPPDDAFTVLDLLVFLSKDKDSRLHVDHPAWQYNAISRARIAASTGLTADEEAAVRAVAADPTTTGIDLLTAIESKIAEIRGTKVQPLKFERVVPANGYPINGITFKGDRPNVSLRIVRDGHVDIGARIDAALKDIQAQIAACAGNLSRASELSTLGNQIAMLPRVFVTHDFRQFAIVADGIINVPVLPLTLSEAAWKVCAKEGLVHGHYPGAGVVTALDITKLPVINRRMVKTISARALFETAFAAEGIKASRKVVDYYLTEVWPKATRSALAAKYGTDAAVWLKEIGITDNGYAPPHTTQAESNDRVTAREYDVSIPGLSSLPTVKDAIAKIGNAKANIGTRLMAYDLTSIEKVCKREGLDYKDIDALKKADPKKLAVLRGVLEKRLAEIDTLRDEYQAKLAQYAFVIVVGQAWPIEWGANMGDLAEDQAEEAAKKAKGKDVKKRIAAKGSLSVALDVPSPTGEKAPPTTLDVTLRLYEVDVDL